MKKPSCTRAPGDKISTSQRIMECTWPDGSGCLIAIYIAADGAPTLDVYRADPGTRLVYVDTDGDTVFASLHSSKQR